MSTHFAVRFVMIAFALGWIAPLALSHWTADKDTVRQ